MYIYIHICICIYTAGGSPTPRGPCWCRERSAPPLSLEREADLIPPQLYSPVYRGRRGVSRASGASCLSLPLSVSLASLSLPNPNLNVSLPLPGPSDL